MAHMGKGVQTGFLISHAKRVKFMGFFMVYNCDTTILQLHWSIHDHTRIGVFGLALISSILSLAMLQAALIQKGMLVKKLRETMMQTTSYQMLIILFVLFWEYLIFWAIFRFTY